MDEYQIVDVPGIGEVEFPVSMPDAEVEAAVRKLTMGSTEAPAPPAPMAPVASHDGPEGLVAKPGAISALGVGAWAGGKAAPTIIEKTGRMLENTRKLPQMIGAGTGLLVGGTAGKAIGGGPGAAIGSIAGYNYGKKAANKVVPSIQKLGETLKLGAENAGNPHAPVWPVKGAKAGSIAGVAKLLGKAGKMAGPVGMGLSIFDLIQTIASGDAAKNIARSAQAMRRGDPRAAMGDLPDDDALLQELMARGPKPTASH